MRVASTWLGLATVVVVGFVPLLAGCEAGTGDGAAPGFARTDSAGVELLVSPSVGAPPAVDWTIGAEPAVVYGGSATNRVEWYRIDDAARLPDGRVVALDAGLHELFYFGSDGELLARAGREGDGPGEFRSPAGLAVLSGDTVLIYVRGSRRFSLFDHEGAWLEDRSLEEVDALGPLQNYRLTDAADGSATLTAVGWYVPADAGSADRALDNPVLRYGTDGAYESEIAEPNTMWLYASGGSVRARVFGTARVSEASAGYVYVRDPESYEIRVYGPSGELDRIYRLIRARRPVASGDVGRYREWLRTDIENPGVLERVLEGLDNRPVADSFPSLEQHFVDERGDIWVTEYAPPWEEERTTAVFASDGPWLGMIELPADVRPLEIGADYVLGVHTDELDIQRLALYDLAR